MLIVLDALADRSVPAWVAGGWGIDAILGQQRRAHADLDLAFRAEAEPDVLAALAQYGYRIVLDYRPARIAVADDAGHEVDLHPVRFDIFGYGVQAGLRDEVFPYAPDSSTTGSIAYRSVAGLTAELQMRFHNGYELPERDREDLARLRATFRLE